MSLSWIIYKNAPVISGKVYVAWKRKILHDVGLHDVNGGHQAYIHRKIGTFMAHRILHLAKTTRGSRDQGARKEIINSLRSRPSAARFARINCLPIIYLTFTDSCRRSANMNKTGCILHFTMTSSLFRHILQGNKSLQIFPNFTSSSLYVSFLSRAKTNSTSWPAPNVWGEVFVAQLVEHCSANAGGHGFESC